MVIIFFTKRNGLAKISHRVAGAVDLSLPDIVLITFCDDKITVVVGSDVQTCNDSWFLVARRHKYTSVNMPDTHDNTSRFRLTILLVAVQ